MRILVTGSHGLVGTPLTERLAQEGHDVIRLVRAPAPSSSTVVLWNPESSDELNQHQLEGLDAVVHLAGENVAVRWSPQKKHRIRNSRVQGTGVLTRALQSLREKPKIFLSASAVGYYGDCGDRLLDETSPLGKGFLASVCRDWEAAAHYLDECGVRVICMRIGLVLSANGGALAKMIPPFRLGLGGRVGSGRQFYSWIHLRDLTEAILFLLHSEQIRGAVNLVTPNPVPNQEFTQALGRALHRPAVLPLPAPLVRMALGEMGEQTLLASNRVIPAVLQQHGFPFAFPTLDDALADLLGGSRTPSTKGAE